jgi:hypothetical protein
MSAWSMPSVSSGGLDVVGASTARSVWSLRRYSPVTNMLDRRYGSVWKPFEIFNFSVATRGIVAAMCFLIAAVAGPMVAMSCSMAVAGLAVVGWEVV